MHKIVIIICAVLFSSLFNHTVSCYVAVKRGSKNKYMKMERNISSVFTLIALIVLIWAIIKV